MHDIFPFKLKLEGSSTWMLRDSLASPLGFDICHKPYFHLEKIVGFSKNTCKNFIYALGVAGEYSFYPSGWTRLFCRNFLLLFLFRRRGRGRFYEAKIDARHRAYNLEHAEKQICNVA